MIRSDYRRARRLQIPSCPVRCGSRRRSRSRARRASSRRLRTLMPRARRRGPAVRARGRRGRVRQEPARARVRPRGGGRAARSCSTAPATRSCSSRTGRSWRRSTSSCATPTPATLRDDLGAGGGELTRLLPDLARGSASCRRAGRGRSRHRAPPPPQRRRRPARRARPAARRCWSSRGRALGGHADAAAAAPPGARLVGRACARAHDVPRHRRRRPGGALGSARRPAPLGGCRASAARRSQRTRRSPSSCSAGRRGRRPGAAEVASRCTS